MGQFSELLKYLNIIYRKRYLFLAVSLFSMTVFIAAAHLVPKKYKAESTVFIEKNVITNLVKDIAVMPDMDERIRVISYALLSRGLISRALENVDAFEVPESQASLNAVLEDLIKRTEVKVNKKDLFVVSIVDENPHFAYEYINALINLYVEENLSGKRAETFGANRFMDEQLVVFKGKLEDAENAIIDFRKTKGVFSTVDDKVALQELRDYQRKIEDIDLTLETQKARKSRSLAQLQQLPRNVSVFSQSNPVDKKSFLQNQLNELLTKYNEDYPEIIRVKAELESLMQPGEAEKKKVSRNTGTSIPNPVYQELQQNVFDLESEISSLDGSRKHLQKIMLLKKTELQDRSEIKKELDRLIQERDSARRIYDEFLMRVGQAEVSNQMELGDKSTTFRIVDAAYLPELPDSPDMGKLILLSIAAGLFIGAGLVVVMESLRNTVTSSKDLKGLGLTVLAEIPTIVDPVVIAMSRKKDVAVYCAALIYFSALVGTMIFEIMTRSH